MNTKVETSETTSEKATEKKDVTRNLDPVTTTSHIPQSNPTRQQDSEKQGLSNVSDYANSDVIYSMT